MPPTVEPFQPQWRPALQRFCEERAEACDAPNALAVARGLLSMESQQLVDQLLVGLVHGVIAGCGRLHIERDLSRCVAQILVTGDADGVGLAEVVVDAALGRARAVGMSRLHVPATSNSELARCLRGAGFRSVRRYASLELPRLAVPAPADPHSQLRPYATEADAALVADLQNACFQGTFGYQPNTRDEIIGYVRERGGPRNVLLADPAVAYVWVSLAGALGRIEMTGVHPAHRRGGHGRRVVAAGVAELFRRGAERIVLDVDVDNRPALALYRGLGFAETASYSWFEKLSA